MWCIQRAKVTWNYPTFLILKATQFPCFPHSWLRPTQWSKGQQKSPALKKNRVSSKKGKLVSAYALCSLLFLARFQTKSRILYSSSLCWPISVKRDPMAAESGREWPKRTVWSHKCIQRATPSSIYFTLSDLSDPKPLNVPSFPLSWLR